ncbi:hypothetical protein GYM68_00185 [Lactobacillus panisapium]|uniref:MFS transporter n=1 Tax=Lactobacillus panisapium TaxID=2012495 RepID=UPI001C6A5C2A|nr:MFS transporter [Lactobacillus panisapium]QYN57773.1 hypothetical protein GYM68_00185 [Lactobacillus panisapium]
MRDKKQIKKIKRLLFIIYFIWLVLIMFLLGEFKTQILNFIHSIGIFSKLPDDLICFAYLFVFIFPAPMIYQKSIDHFSKKYHA